VAESSSSALGSEGSGIRAGASRAPAGALCRVASLYAALVAAALLVGVAIPAPAGAQISAPGTWATRASAPEPRQEVSYVQTGGKFYLAGGGTEQWAYDANTDSWSSVAPLPAPRDHIQGVAVGGRIYYIGGLTSWPSGHVETVYIYDPVTDTFRHGAPMPPGRGRGAGGVAAYKGKIYYAGGLHAGSAVPWLDVYDPATDTWTSLPDMPRARDHFHAAVVGGKLYAIGGRNTDIDATTTANDAYDIKAGTWSTGLAPLPTARGGFAAAVVGNEVVIVGGEGGGRTFNDVEAYDTVTNTWRTLASMPTGRHGIQAATCNGGVYVAAGGTAQGGSHPTAAHEVLFLGEPAECAAVGFGKSTLKGETSDLPTSLQFGPDGRLYVGEVDGKIQIYDVARNGSNDYSVTRSQAIESVKSIVNHDDTGTVNSSVVGRLLTGILVAGTAERPVIYATSSDPRVGGLDGTDSNLDTNSGTLTRLTWDGTSWQRHDLVRGLPRSEENHASNGMALDTATDTLYVAQGGNTNQGAPSQDFAFIPEYALSAAILAIDLGVIGDTTYDLSTLDDESRDGSADAGDPFGGNDGANQANLVPGGPVQVYAAGFRNPYDVIRTRTGRMYTIDNGANTGWGGAPLGEGPSGTCTNEVSEPGTNEPDTLHRITGVGYYGGHPNPTRGNKANTFNATNPQSPVLSANPMECDYRDPATERGALTAFGSSTNGIAEYTASNFGGAMDGDLLAAGYVLNEIYRIRLSPTGTAADANKALFSSAGTNPLDLTALGDADPFPGTVWMADNGSGNILVFEPNDYRSPPRCTRADTSSVDEDADRYSNADEIDNGTDPCSAADLPPDADGDGLSNRNDADDDNDGRPDMSDPFAVDASNGTTTSIPVHHGWENNEPRTRGILGLGFTGLMTNGRSDYEALFDVRKMTAGGAAGVLTVDEVSEGDALGPLNTQEYAFQLGVNAGSHPAGFAARARILAPFAGLQPHDGQSIGIFLGTGDQDNYVKLTTVAGGIRLVREVDGAVTDRFDGSLHLPGPDHADLHLAVNPQAHTVQASYSVTANGVRGRRQPLGDPVSIPESWLRGQTALAVGIISTSSGPAPPFPASWDFIEVTPADATAPETSITSGPLGPTGSSSASFAFSSSEEGSTFECRLDDREWEGCGSPPHYSGLSEGPHVFRVRAIDGAANVDPDPAARSWTVDTVPPDTRISSGPAARSTSPAATFEFSSSEPGATFECRLEGLVWERCASPRSYAGLRRGLHAFDVRAIDAAGNTDATAASWRWSVATSETQRRGFGRDPRVDVRLARRAGPIVRVTVTNRNPFKVTGVVTLVAARTVPATRGARGRGRRRATVPRRVRLARRSFVVLARHRRTVRIRLAPRHARRLAQFRRIPAVLIVTLRDPRGTPWAVRRHFQLVAARARTKAQRGAPTRARARARR
jgi:N-acetylneuraminic acid mutarotase